MRPLPLARISKLIAKSVNGRLLILSSANSGYKSPLRHHHRTASHPREVKETLNAHSEYTNNEDDGKAEHHLNQYVIKEEIGRGSFGAVHLAVDQYGTEYVSVPSMIKILVYYMMPVVADIGCIGC